MVYPEENETGPTSQRIREKTRGSATRAFGHEQKYQGYFCSVSHTRSQSNNNCSYCNYYSLSFDAYLPVTRDVVRCENLAMAAQQTGDGQLHKPNNSLGIDYQRNRVSIRHSGGVIFHVPPLVVLGEFGHIRVVGSFRRDTRSIYIIEFRMRLNKCYTCNDYCDFRRY